MRVAPTARRRRLRRSAPEHEEAALDERIAARATVTRANTIAVMSPKGGVGKTTCAFLLGNLLASTAKLRCVAVDANPDFGTLGSLAPDSSRAPGSLLEILARIERIHCAAELRPLVAALPTGLDLIAPPPDPAETAAITPEVLALPTDVLRRFYDVILLDLGAGMAGPLARFALGRADQSMLVSTADFVSASTVLVALRHLRGHSLTMVINQAPRLPGEGARREIEHELARQQIKQYAIVPYDGQLRVMLDSGTYDLAALDRETRMSIKRLGRSAAEWLV